VEEFLLLLWWWRHSFVSYPICEPLQNKQSEFGTSECPFRSLSKILLDFFGRKETPVCSHQSVERKRIMITSYDNFRECIYFDNILS